jgi:hypothetical protein
MFSAKNNGRGAGRVVHVALIGHAGLIVTALAVWNGSKSQ